MKREKEVRQWQVDASKEIKEALKKKHSIVSVAACVGSGKTYVAWDAMSQFIKKHPNKKTLQVFVCPRINLCSQQAKDAFEYLNNECGAGNVSVKLVNSDTDDTIIGKRRNAKTGEWEKDPDYSGNYFGSKIEHFRDFSQIPGDSIASHTVFVFCDASLWGDSEATDQEDSHLGRFFNFLDKAKDLGVRLGVIAYDEAHNYQNRQLAMFGNEYN